jgi:membrane-associated phospholipid phosphatase
MTDTPQTPPLPTEEQQVRRWTAYRRPVFLITTLVGLVVVVLFIPPLIWRGLWEAIISQSELVTLIALFCLIALSLVWSAGEQMDAWIFRAFNLHGFRPKWLDLVMWAATQLGNMVTALVLACVLFILDFHREGIEVLLGVFTLWVVVEAIKALTGRARPFLALEGARVVGWKEPGRSFPSGHTSQTFFLTVLMISRFQPPVGAVVVIYLLAILVGITRIYVGAHYPRDVIGGMVLGSIWGIMMSLIDPYLAGLNF